MSRSKKLKRYSLKKWKRKAKSNEELLLYSNGAIILKESQLNKWLEGDPEELHKFIMRMRVERQGWGKVIKNVRDLEVFFQSEEINELFDEIDDFQRVEVVHE